MLKGREWRWPWEKDPNGVQDPAQSSNAAEIIIPEDGLKEGKSFTFKGRMRRLEGAAPADVKVNRPPTLF
jgi:hypothetical protein